MTASIDFSPGPGAAEVPRPPLLAGRPGQRTPIISARLATAAEAAHYHDR
jgi:hypothetical protein